VPTGITAIVQKAEPGADLACRALDHRFEDGGVTVERGVISYYAVNALPQATTVGRWLSAMDRAANDDLRRGRITSFHLPSLQVVGDAGTPVPGEAVTSSAAPGVMLASGAAPPATWFVLSREDGCLPLDILQRGDRLPRVPTSPADYEAMLRARGEQPTLALPPGFPPDLAGKVVMVQTRPDRAPILVRADVCRQMRGKSLDISSRGLRVPGGHGPREGSRHPLPATVVSLDTGGRWIREAVFRW
jgi:hypothetical protein